VADVRDPRRRAKLDPRSASALALLALGVQVVVGVEVKSHGR
jgi:hypothetical protein